MVYYVISSELSTSKAGTSFYRLSLASDVEQITCFCFSSEAPSKGSIIEANPRKNDKGFYNLSSYAVIGNAMTDPQLFDQYPCFKRFATRVPLADEFVKAVVAPIKDCSPEFVDALSKIAYELYESYKLSYAATKLHHAYPGGLAQHTFEVLSILRGLKVYMQVDNPIRWDIVTVAALFHDYGKLWEYTEEGVYTETIALTPHSVLGAQKVGSFVSNLFTPAELQIIEHCILAHHGSCATVPPACVEAVILSHADMLSGHLFAMKNTPHMARCFMGGNNTVIDTEHYTNGKV